MSESTKPSEIPNIIRGVFAFLDATIAPEIVKQIAQGSTVDLQSDRYGSVLRTLAESIKTEFHLMHWGSEVRKALDAYRLYSAHDMADALSKAYILQRRGEDPRLAFRADYSLKKAGLLYWMTAGDLDTEYFLGATNRQECRELYRHGDRFVRAETPGNFDLFHLRGDRVVKRVLLTHGSTGPEISTRWLADVAKFEELGGTAGFLAGKFIWPPPDWVNPIRPEDDPGLV
ncbi:MAG: hypothetical protein IPP19_10045 [Verrucomicrobia bacterium]|nr:hypothetical protein [Verrucomicrobiota bacterium]